MSNTSNSVNSQTGATVTGVTTHTGNNSSVNIGNTTQNIFDQQEPIFFERTNFDKFKSPYFPSPKITNTIIDKLIEQRLLILGGHHEDISDMARHFAWKLCEKFQSKCSIREWSGSSSSQSLFAAIREGTQEPKNSENIPKIFVLYSLKPSDVKLDLEKVKDEAAAGGNYVIATSEKSSSEWNIQPTQTELIWQPSPEELLYESEDLVKSITQRLEEKNLDNAIIKRWESSTELDFLKIIEENLKTVASIQDFVVYFNLLLEKKKEPLSNETILKAIDSAKDRKNSIKIRIEKALDERQKLLLLALNLFNGLFEDQFFAALKMVVKNAWYQRDSTLLGIDYSDLDSLKDYFDFVDAEAYISHADNFKFVKTDKNTTKLEIRQVKIHRLHERHILLELAWSSHRRQIISVLSTVVEIVKNSVKRPISDWDASSWEIYGNSLKRQQLYNVISQTLSDIGLISISATTEVQNSLLSLASNELIEVQNIAAEAIAQWYYSGHKETFFMTIKQLYSTAMQKEINRQNNKDWHYIVATVALTITHVAVKTLPENFTEEFIYWLQELAENKNKIVRTYFGGFILRYLVVLHLQQMREHLQNWAQNDEELNYPIAVALAIAYKEKPEEVNDLLEEWEHNERLLVTVALTYGEIDCEK